MNHSKGTAVARGDSLKRQWSLVRTLQMHRFGLTLDELAEQLDCNRRTIQRDISVLRAVGLPIDYATNDDSQRRYALPHGFLDGSKLFLSIADALGLYLAKAFMAPLSGTSIGEAFDDLVGRIEQSLSPKTLRHFRDLQTRLLVHSPGMPDYTGSREIVAAVDTAVRERRVLTITYHSQWRGDDYTTDVHPYGLVFWQADLYLVAFSVRAEAIRVFKVARIHDTRLTGKIFERPDDFDLEDYFSSSLSVIRAGEPFEARVQFTGPAINLVLERKWHPSQRVVIHEGDRLVIKLTICDPIGIKQWVKSYGPHAELLAPEPLRRELRDELCAAVALYERPTTRPQAED